MLARLLTALTAPATGPTAPEEAASALESFSLSNPSPTSLHLSDNQPTADGAKPLSTSLDYDDDESTAKALGEGALPLDIFVRINQLAAPQQLATLLSLSRAFFYLTARRYYHYSCRIHSFNCFPPPDPTKDHSVLTWCCHFERLRVGARTYLAAAPIAKGSIEFHDVRKMWIKHERIVVAGIRTAGEPFGLFWGSLERLETLRQPTAVQLRKLKADFPASWEENMSPAIFVEILRPDGIAMACHAWDAPVFVFELNDAVEDDDAEMGGLVYPDGTVGSAIPLEGRVVVWDLLGDRTPSHYTFDTPSGYCGGASIEFVHRHLLVLTVIGGSVDKPVEIHTYLVWHPKKGFCSSIPISRPESKYSTAPPIKYIPRVQEFGDSLPGGFLSQGTAWMHDGSPPDEDDLDLKPRSQESSLMLFSRLGQELHPWEEYTIIETNPTLIRRYGMEPSTRAVQNGFSWATESRWETSTQPKRDDNLEWTTVPLAPSPPPEVSWMDPMCAQISEEQGKKSYDFEGGFKNRRFRGCCNLI
ncbi:hypothetical protein MNV49_002295 [Pseudohyphozyma bogoriensis]|nr:hypothetical protein MNV49_002295 [Pseudohyphozyma bogoriensis]